MSKVVLSVGQCGFDHSSISKLLEKIGAVTHKIDFHSEVFNAIDKFKPCLILINRINDSDGSTGLTLIREIKGNPIYSNINVMLVSNYESAQKEAIELGALNGFGKNELSSSNTFNLLAEVINSSA